MTPTHSLNTWRGKVSSYVWPETREKVELEIGLLHRLVDSHKSLIAKVSHIEPNTVELSALSAYLHSFYTGIENVFKQIAAGIDNQQPSADRWHTDLLKLMSVPSPNRPALISEVLLTKLIGYMGFRHVFRHAYTFDLKWRKMETLVSESEAVLREIEQACHALFEA